jgi:hypothetical protein
LRERIAAYVSAVTAETVNVQVARWDRRLCLNVEGVSDAQRAYLGGAIAAEGRALGLEVEAGRRCEPAAFVIFSADPDALLARLGDSRPYFFGGIPPEARRGLRADERRCAGSPSRSFAAPAASLRPASPWISARAGPSASCLPSERCRRGWKRARGWMCSRWSC